MGKYETCPLWGVMCGQTLVLSLAETRSEARVMAKIARRMVDQFPDVYPAGPIRVVRVTVSVDD